MPDYFDDIFDEPAPAKITQNKGKTKNGELAHLEEEGIKEIEYCLRQMETQTHHLRGILGNMEAAQTLQKSLKPENDIYNNKGQYQFEKDLFQISVTEKDGIVEILVPALLPHRKNKPETLFMETLAQALEEYLQQENNLFPRLSADGVLLVIIHSYKRKWMVRDNDNIEISSLINTLVTTGLIQKDTGDYLGVFSTASCQGGEADNNQTRILLVPKSLAHVSTGGKGSPLWEW